MDAHTLMSPMLRASVLLALTLTAPLAAAQEEVLDTAAVRHRLYSTAGRLEVSAALGLPLNTYLTRHFNLEASAAWHLTGTLALEGRAGYALSSHTGLASSISQSFLARVDKEVTDELEDMWQMGLHGAAGVRWSPIYGKISLFTDATAHFQAYLWGGGGLAALQRESIIQCTEVVNRSQGLCNAWATESRLAPVGSVAFGMRFFFSGNHGVRLELRDWFFGDSYRTGLVRAEWEAGRPTGRQAPNPGLTHLVFLDLGYSFLF